jgi:DNA modification methylase
LTPFVNDGDFTLHVGDALDVLRDMPDESVHCVVTSPPYWGLRCYAACGCVNEGRLEIAEDERGDRHTAGGAIAFHRQGQPNPECPDCNGTGKRADVEGQQLGLEPTPDTYITRMVQVFREVRRVLRRDGTCWLNIGDSYASNGSGTGSDNATHRGDPAGDFRNGTSYLGQGNPRTAVDGLKVKDMCGIPWKLAFALQADGWYLRSDIIWAKPNPMPESVTDRPTKAHEYVFLLTREARYFFDADAIREDGTGRNWATAGGNLMGSGIHKHVDGYIDRGNGRNREDAFGRNARSVWTIATQPYAEAHFATFPEELPRRCIAAGTSERGCCPACGAPWEREVERAARPEVERGSDRLVPGENGRSSRKVGQEYQDWLDANPSQTIAWHPSCEHIFTPDPCTVLDPFMGSGTVALVARRLGRKSIGIELNPEYAELCARRLQQQSLFACVVDESVGLKDTVG